MMNRSTKNIVSIIALTAVWVSPDLLPGRNGVEVNGSVPGVHPREQLLCIGVDDPQVLHEADGGKVKKGGGGGECFKCYPDGGTPPMKWSKAPHHTTPRPLDYTIQYIEFSMNN